MSYQALMVAIEQKVSERLAERERELADLHVELMTGESDKSLALRARIRLVNHQIAKLSSALASMAESAGSE